MMSGDLPQFLSDDLCRRPANSAVHLIEDDRSDGTGPGQHLFQGEHDARQLPSGGNRPERLPLFAHIRRKVKLRRIQAVFVQ